MIKLLNGSCNDYLTDIFIEYKDRNIVIVSDPPFNLGYHYKTYKDKLNEEDYYNWLGGIFGSLPSVVIHYPEPLYKLSYYMQQIPDKVISWVYNSNTAKQHRDIAFFGIKPDLTLVKQPYKNPSDKRIKERIANGKIGARLYDWWNINQVKNVSKKHSHPCQMPLEVMENIIGILPRDVLVIDPFMGTGTTGVACQKYGVDFIGIELDKEYFEIAQNRLKEMKLDE